jgi:PAS domain S-box-containing protein
MHLDDEEKLIHSVALQNARAVLLARERAERELMAAKEALERKSLELAEQREFFRVTLSSIGDGVIAADTQGQITFLNPVAEAMTGWKLDDAIGQPLENVFNIVNEESRKPATNPVVKVLLDGAVVGLANHTLLIARDGRETAIADSAAPIRDATGKISGVVMVFHDVTEERRAETALRESNQLLNEAREHLENRVRERTGELNAANESLRDLSGRLMQIRDNEARALARELHDSAGQLLAALSINVATVKSQAHKLDEAGAKAVTENLLLIGQLNTEIRTMSHLLHPPLLDELGLRSALRWYVDGFSERSNVKVELEIASDFSRLSTALETAVFRIVQECLTNIHRHSGSKTAVIRIRRESGQIVVVAQDSGKGISPDKMQVITGGRSGVGFRGMVERIRHLGGDLKIQSNGEGTVVTASLPLELANVVSGNE